MRKATIIAEVGNNHEGVFKNAIDMRIAAVKAGAMLVKFQAGTAEGFARTPEDVGRYRKYELTMAQYKTLREYGTGMGVHVLFSVWGDGFDDLMAGGVFRKIAARQCTPEYIAKWDGIGATISIPHTMPLDDVQKLGIQSGVPLHCVSEYPAEFPYWERFDKLKDMFGGRIGFSDHFVGIDTAKEAIRRGAVIVEKHFTLSHDFGPLRDHKLSATPDELKDLIEFAR